MILVDVFYESLSTTESGLEIVLAKNLSEKKRVDIATLATGHVRRLVKRMKRKNDSIGSINTDLTTHS